MRHVLGLSAFYHDSAAALVRDGVIVAAAQEERFSRRKNDESFPAQAAAWCLRAAGLGPEGLNAVVFYDKPILKFARVLETYLALAPRGARSFLRTLPAWLGGKLNLRDTIRAELPGLRADCPVLFTQHHEAHAASAFFPSPFAAAAILTVDGVGEYATTTLGRGAGAEIGLLEELRFPHSLGLLYSACTAYCGFRVNSGEYKLMGLAPFGEPRHVAAIRDHLLDLREDGSFWLNLDHFDLLNPVRLTNERFHALFGGPPRDPARPLEARHADLACSIQAVCEEAMLGLARRAHARTGLPDLCLAGGVALNCVANGRLLREGPFRRLWIQPAAGDAGGALGAALLAWHRHFGGARTPAPRDAMQGARLGPGFSQAEIEAALAGLGAVFTTLPDEAAVVAHAADLLAAGKVVGWVQGRLEFGPRALGGRSILGDPRLPAMQSVMNLKVKFRESFRPFAPAVLRERAAEWFELDAESPYMLLVAAVRPERRVPAAGGATGLDRVREVRSQIPAVTHVDHSARVQTVDAADDPLFHALLRAFEARTGCPVLVNTSFNVRGEPVVCTPAEACRCFVNTAMDHLVVGRCVLDRGAQPARALPRPVPPGPD
jgi:carbamoyltransferase